MAENSASIPAFRSRPVADVVAEDYRRAPVFKEYGIDFCCKGAQTVERACERKGIAYEEVEAALRACGPAGMLDETDDPRTWAVEKLVDHIQSVHHSYVRRTLPHLQAFAGKVAKVHGHHRAELLEVATLVDELASEMEQHMHEEESVLFPAFSGGTEGDGTLDPQILGRMEEDHERVAEILERIRALTDGYTPPPEACNTYRAMYVNLEEFEDDLHRHVHLENHVLFPRARGEAQGMGGETQRGGGPKPAA